MSVNDDKGEESNGSAPRRTARLRKENKHKNSIGEATSSGYKSSSSQFSQSSSSQLKLKSKIRINKRKSAPVKSASSVASVVVKNSIFHNQQYYQVGDVVLLMDDNDDVYYAQLRGFLQDQYLSKYCALTWLLPTKESPKDGNFDPRTFILGPEEDCLRSMEAVDFVCHCPDDYFGRLGAPMDTTKNALSADTISNAGFVSTTFSHEMESFVNMSQQ